jgi:hypothetical protein
MRLVLLVSSINVRPARPVSALLVIASSVVLALNPATAALLVLFSLVQCVVMVSV